MESGKHGASSESNSSEENCDRSEQVNLEITNAQSSAKRSYECTYCKRGFTNAQALGGHMNIHRKDRAKAKQQNLVFSNSFGHYYQPRNDQETVPGFNPDSNPFSSQLPAWHQPVFQPSIGPSVASPFPFGFSSYETGSSLAPLAVSSEEIMGADLSLQIDSNAGYLDRDGCEEARQGLANDVLDLELRLGYR